MSVFEVALLQCIYLRTRDTSFYEKIASLTTSVRSIKQIHVLRVTLPVATMIPGTDFLLVIGPDV